MENPIRWMIWGYLYFWKHPYIENIEEVCRKRNPARTNEKLTDFLFLTCMGGHVARNGEVVADNDLSLIFWVGFLNLCSYGVFFVNLLFPRAPHTLMEGV